MAERFVRGWAVDPSALAAFAGADEVRAWVGAAAEAGHSLVLVMDGDQ